MRVKILLLLLITVISIQLSIQFAAAATIHGSVYDASYNLLKDVKLEINTEPKQNHVSKNGLYFFYVPVGDYEISVEKMYNGNLSFTAKKYVQITNDGEFTIDIIAERVPGSEIPDEGPPALLPVLIAKLGGFFYPSIIIAIVLFIALILLTIYFFRHFFSKRKRHIPRHDYLREIEEYKDVDKEDENSDKETRSTNNQDTLNVHTQQPTISYTIHDNSNSVNEIPGISQKEETKELSQPDVSDTAIPIDSEYSLDNLINIIREEGGRTTQKDIRRRIPLSEAKVSLMISELEAKGKIEKIKKGRGNIIVLKDESKAA